MIELTGKTLICGGGVTGKSTLLTSVAQTMMGGSQFSGMMYYGSSFSYEKFLGEKQSDQRFQFFPVYQSPFNKHSPGVKKLIWAIENIERLPGQLLVLIDEPHNLFPKKPLAAEFAQAVVRLNAREKQKLTLCMTAKRTNDIEILFGEKFLCEFENHILLRNVPQYFYASIIKTEAIEKGAAIPILNGEKKSPLRFEVGLPETVRQSELAPKAAAGLFERIFSK